jgi:phenylpropionate dioxygenase-like ring-hydroxylating dioxygenase large terminal subunit
MGLNQNGVTGAMALKPSKPHAKDYRDWPGICFSRPAVDQRKCRMKSQDEIGGSDALSRLVKAVMDGGGKTARTAETLPPEVYNSQAFFDLEMKRIFEAEWLCVGHVSQVANVGDYFTLDLLGEPLVVVRGKDRIRVMSRVCLHRWAPVVEGEGNTKVFSCPFHRWGYGLDGRLISAPFMDKADDFEPKSCSLPEIRTEIVAPLGLIFVTFAETIDPIGERLADLCDRLKNWTMGELVSVVPSTMDVAYNWKIQLETGMECYHHFAAHPGTFEVHFPTRLSWCEDSRKGWTVCHSPARPEAPDEVFTMGFPMMPHLDPAERRVFDLYHIFPLTRLSVHGDRINLRILTPVGPSRTTSKFVTLLRPEVAAQDDLVARMFAERAPFAAQAGREDDAIDLMQQVGAASRYARPGRLSHLEATVWHLAEYLRSKIGDYPPADAAGV